MAPLLGCVDTLHMRDRARVNFCCCAECCVAYRYVDDLLLRDWWGVGEGVTVSVAIC